MLFPANALSPISRTAAARNNTLLQGLESYWKLDEASGSRADSVGGNTLTDSGSVGQAVGKVGSSAQFVRASSKSLLHSDNASLSTGDIDFTLACWCYIDSKSGNSPMISKLDAAPNFEHLFYHANGTDRFTFAVSPAGSTLSSVAATTFGSPSLATWYFVVAWHDSVNNTLNIQVNNGTVDSVSYSSGVFNSAANFYIGKHGNGEFWDGRIDEALFYKRVLTAPERTQLFAGGSGTTYPF